MISNELKASSHHHRALTWLDLAGISLRPRSVHDEQQRQHEDHRDPNDARQGHPLGPGADRALFSGTEGSGTDRVAEARPYGALRGEGGSKQSINQNPIPRAV